MEEAPSVHTFQVSLTAPPALVTLTHVSNVQSSPVSLAFYNGDGQLFRAFPWSRILDVEMVGGDHAATPALLVPSTRGGLIQ